MQVTVVNVSREDRPNKTGGTYGVLTVAFRNAEGKLTEKKLMSFQNPQVFKHFERVSPGDLVEVTSVKVGDYWQWTAIGVATVVAPADSTSKATAAPPKSNYETSEERADRQRLIVRQSSLSAAVNVLTVGAKALDKEAVKALARDFEEWVFRVDTPKIDSFDTMEDDIPY